MDQPTQPQGSAEPAAQAPPDPGATPAPPAAGAPPDWPPASSPPPSSPPDASSAAYLPAWPSPVETIGPAAGVAFASHGGRLVAYVVDGILITVLVVGVAFALALLTGVLAATGLVPLAVLSSILFFIAMFAFGLGYLPWFWVHGGATPGMRLFNLKLVRDRDGGPVGWGAAILRLIGMWVSAAVFYLGFVWILIDGRRRGWHDLIAGTVMVQPA